MIQPELSFVLPAKSPLNLGTFYSFVMGEEIQPGFTKDHLCLSHPNGSSIQIFRPSEKNPFPLTGTSLGLCFYGEPSSNPLKDLDDWVSSVMSKGAKRITSTSLQSFGAEAWVADPEGNYLLLVIPLECD